MPRRRVLAACAAASLRSWRAVAAPAAALAAASAWSQEPSFSTQARRRLLPGDAVEPARRVAEREALLVEGERHLRAGQATAARSAFESAALMQHAADTELGIVRSQMAAGEYRRSLAFGAHTAGVHRDQAAGSALYVWLLRLGGQAQVARHYLDEAMALAPEHALLLSVSGLLDEPWPQAEGSLLQPPWRAAPYAWAEGTLPPKALAVVGTVTLMAEGRTALMPATLAARAPDGRLWLRNGLGQTTAARVEATLTGGVGEPARFVPWQALSAGIELPRADPAVLVAGLPDVVCEHAMRAAVQVLLPA